MNDEDRDVYLERVDALAHRLVERSAPICWEVADSPAAREAVWRLRAEAVIARGWARPDDLHGGLERDEDDERAIHVGGWDGDVLAVTGRLIFPSSGMRLPTETQFDVLAEPRGCVVNFDRVVVARSHSTHEQQVLKALIAKCWLETRMRGFHLWLGVLTPAMIRLYRRIGWQVTILGPPRLFWGEERLPVRFDPFQGLARVKADPEVSATSGMREGGSV